MDPSSPSQSQSRLRELSSLLDRFCEGALAPEEIQKLETLVIEDACCLQYYLDYMQIHGQLTWDQCQTGERRKLSAMIKGVAHRSTRRVMQTTYRYATSAILVLAVCLGFWTWISENTSHRDQTVVDNQLAEKVSPDFDEQPQLVPGIASHGSTSQQSPDKNEETASTLRPDMLQPAQEPQIAEKTAVFDSSKRHIQDSDNSSTAPVLVSLSDDEIVQKIDYELSEEWAAAELTPTAQADDATWIRRVYMDLWGRIPTVRELNSFVDASDDGKRRQIIHRLVNDMQFGRHYAEGWTNLLVGMQPNRMVHRPQLRNYLANRFNQNPHWDAIVGELIAAEGNPAEDGPSNFLVAHLNNQAVPATAVTARLFLCKQMQCVQCHNHPFNNMTQDEFWQLNSFFKQTRIQQAQSQQLMSPPSMTSASLVPSIPVQLVSLKQGGPTFYESRNELMHVAFPEYAGIKVKEDDQVNRRVELAQILKTNGQRELASAFVNRVWAHFFSYGFVNPIDDLGSHNPPVYPQIFNFVTEQFIASNFDVKRLMTWICRSQLYQLSSLTASDNLDDHPESGTSPLFTRVYLKPMTAEQLYDSCSLLSANYPSDENTFAEYEVSRDTWIRQFSRSSQNDENQETTSLNGTIPQALELINGPLSNSTIRHITREVSKDLDQGRLTADDDVKMISAISRRILSRDPSEKEMQAYRRVLMSVRQSATPKEELLIRNYQQALEDIAWAYLNANEFTLVQ